MEIVFFTATDRMNFNCMVLVTTRWFQGDTLKIHEKFGRNFVVLTKIQTTSRTGHQPIARNPKQIDWQILSDLPHAPVEQ